MRRRALRVKRLAKGEEESLEGLGGCHQLAQTDARRLPGQVVCHHLDSQLWMVAPLARLVVPAGAISRR